MNPLVEVLKSQEERDRLRNIEQLRRKGERFIRVRYKGTAIPQIDSEGVCYNIRMHGLEDIEAFESTNVNDGKVEYKTRRGARALCFRQTGSGDIEADVWDDPRGWNRRYIYTHLDELEVLDKDVLEQIKDDGKKPFNAEPSRKELLEQEISDKIRELDQLNQQEIEQKKRGRPKGKDKDGINESTSGVDSPGVSRVATRGNGKGDTPSI